MFLGARKVRGAARGLEKAQFAFRWGTDDSQRVLMETFGKINIYLNSLNKISLQFLCIEIVAIHPLLSHSSRLTLLTQAAAEPYRCPLSRVSRRRSAFPHQRAAYFSNYFMHFSGENLLINREGTTVGILSPDSPPKDSITELAIYALLTRFGILTEAEMGTSSQVLLPKGKTNGRSREMQQTALCPFPRLGELQLCTHMDGPVDRILGP